MSNITKPRIVLLLLIACVLSGCVSRRDYKYPYFGGGTNASVPPRGSGVSRGL
ncbi:hypothetical protein [Verrucomicrobium spinosum]|uniref:hypothetical protein n=1 Tax=Verrucomicrobium spinosum TaxID=2736 RepID=UPI000AA377EB|nr:hypothetical protein [Verrucomicrobium spinosum]